MRQIKGHRGCIIRGWVNIDDFSHCGDETCPSCNRSSEALNDALKSLNFKYTTHNFSDIMFHYRTQEGSVIIPVPKDYDRVGYVPKITKEHLKNTEEHVFGDERKFAYYKDKYPWLEKSNDHECFNGMHIDKFKIPFNYLYLVDGDRLENESGDSLIYREQDHAYTFINNDFTRFLSKSMIYQEWKKIY